MKKAVVLLMMAGLAGAALMIASQAQEAAVPGALEKADSLFKEGKFAEAADGYAEALNADPKSFRAFFRLGSIALLSNNFMAAEMRLKEALALKPDDSAAKSLLAELYCRKDDFGLAAKLFRETGDLARAAQLESFKGQTPYSVDGGGAETVLPFVLTDPLPVVSLKVNGDRTVNFFIDTGGPQVILDAEFAKELGIKDFGSETGTFAGGKKAAYGFGRVDSLTLGDYVIRNVPVALMQVRRFSKPVFRGTQVDGIIGTVLLYHFLSTIDYPGGRLVLRRPSAEAGQHFAGEAASAQAVVVPFWMAGDHFMVGWGTVNESAPLLFFVDTGLAGGGFTCPESTVKLAGIKLNESAAGEGIGGGGKVRTVPFVVKELTFGAAREENVPGMFSGAFPVENALGFHIGGLISHGFFRPYALTFDFRGMKIYLERKEKAA
jgi:hypothetical protein